MALPSLDYAYRYVFASEVAEADAGARLRLATFDAAADPVFFFSGRMLSPMMAADALGSLGRTVTSRFFVPGNLIAAAILDPVATCCDDIIRFEAFSSCCSVYVRADFPKEAWTGIVHSRGTTNVDFNPRFREILARLGTLQWLELAIGANELRVAGPAGTAVERKVTLPTRWMKAFVEVQACQVAVRPRLEVNGVEARRFLHGLPANTQAHTEAWAAPVGSGLRLTHRPSASAVRIAAWQRLKVLGTMARHADRLRIYGDDATGVSVWEMTGQSVRFTAALTPDASRGFSGEGQVLAHLASGLGLDALPHVRAALNWQSSLDVAELAARTGFAADQVVAALAILAARGLVGYDLHQQAYFHRVLPFDISRVDSTQPRLKAASRLLAADGVRIKLQSEAVTELLVQGTGVEHSCGLPAANSSVRARGIPNITTIAARANTSWPRKSSWEISSGACRIQEVDETA